MTPDDERRAAAVPGVPCGDNASALVRRMRECAEWHAGEVAGQALSAGADEVERLTGELERLRGMATPDPTERCPVDPYAATVLGHRAQPTGDLAGLARREAGPVTRRQWRACARCGQCFWLADDEAVPGHGVRDAWGADRACGAVVTSEGSEGR